MEPGDTIEVCTRFEQTEFCYVCACYIKKEKERKSITEEIAEMFYDIYGEEMNLSCLDSPERICAKCENSIKNYVTGESEVLRVKEPAKWGECKPDHSDCFYHLVIVDIGHDRTRLPTKGACFIAPRRV